MTGELLPTPLGGKEFVITVRSFVALVILRKAWIHSVGSSLRRGAMLLTANSGMSERSEVR